MPCTLVVHTGGIGDFILAMPAISAIAKDGPVELAGYRDRLELAVEGGVARAAHSLDAIGFHSLFGDPTPKLCEFLSRFDRVVVWMRDSEGVIHRGLERCGIQHADIFPGLPDFDWQRHASEYYAECLGVPISSDFMLDIVPSGSPLDVVIHPGSGSPKKNWAIENFAALAEELRRASQTVTWCQGPAEMERESLVQGADNVLRCASLVELATRLATARLYIGNDSGITHLAAVLGVHTIAIFGPTNPAVWAPLGRCVDVLHGTPWPTVLEALSKSKTMTT